jgi:hypothetical protein
MKAVNCGYRNHDFKPTGRKEGVYTEFECTKCGISTSWESEGETLEEISDSI